MQFVYRAFTIERSVKLVGDTYVGQATIYSSASGKDLVECFKTDLLPSFSTQIQAIGYIRNFANATMAMLQVRGSCRRAKAASNPLH
jgi:hypothetical protein